jgi:alpha-1,3-mannosyltransferase
MAVLSPTPFTKPYNTRFRRGNKEKGECAASECTLICSDFWKAGWGRVQVVPSVQVRHVSCYRADESLHMNGAKHYNHIHY